MAWFGRRRAEDEPTLDQLRRWHLLLVPSEVGVERVDALLRNRYPDARLAETGRARLGRQSAISGPYGLEPDEVDVVRVPPGWSAAYALEVAPEPDPAAFDDIGDPVLRAWWMRAFPQGKPFREEGDAVELALALARRFAGALRAAGTNVVLQPDHGRVVDLTVWSGYWVDPDRLLDLLAPVLPGAQLDLGGRGRHAALAPPRDPSDTDWDMDPLDPLAVDLEHALGTHDHALIEEVAEEHDAHALGSGVVLDGYALSALGNVVVEVMQEDAVPGWVRGRVGHQLLAEGNPVVTYTVRWLPHEPELLESEDPPYGFRLERDRVRPRMQAAALALAEATAGVVSDTAGFEVDRYAL
jgi:hypothetical protein